MQKIEDYVIVELTKRVDPSIRIVRYTDASWGGITEYTTTFHGATREELGESIGNALDGLLIGIKLTQAGDNAVVIGVKASRVSQTEQKFLGCYLNLYLGPIQGGDDFVL